MEADTKVAVEAEVDTKDETNAKPVTEIPAIRPVTPPIDVNKLPLIRPVTPPIDVEKLIRWVTAIHIRDDPDGQEDPRTLHDPYDADEKGDPKDIVRQPSHPPPAVQWTEGEGNKFINKSTFVDIPRDEDEWEAYDPRYDDENGDVPPVPAKIYTGIAEVDLQFKERSKSMEPHMTEEDEWLELIAVIVLKLGAKLLESDFERYAYFARGTVRHQEENNNRELLFVMNEVMNDRAADTKSRADYLFAGLCHYILMRMRF